MTVYATQQDIIDRYGEQHLLILADRDNDGQADTDVVDQALQDATSEIDTYVAAKYVTPLATVPDALKRICVDIVVYRLASDRGRATDEARKRYEDAIGLLRRIASGEVSLGVATPPPTSNGAVFISGPAPKFKRGRNRF